MPDNDQNIGIVTTFFVLALALLLYYTRLHSGGDMLTGLLMDLCMVFTPPLVSVLRAWEVMNSPDPFAASTTAAKALNAVSEAVIFGRFSTGCFLGTHTLQDARHRLLFCAVQLGMFSVPPLVVYAVHGETEWLSAVARLVLVPMATGSAFTIFAWEKVVRPAFQRLSQLEEDQQQLQKELRRHHDSSSSTENEHTDEHANGELERAASKSSSSRDSAVSEEWLASAPTVFDSISQMREFQLEWLEQRELGSGSFSRAVLIHNPRTGEYAVSKQVYVGQASTDTVVQLKRETSTLASLPRHEHIIRYMTCYLRGEVMCIITDYASGGTLQHAIKRVRCAAVDSSSSSSSAAAQRAGGSGADHAPPNAGGGERRSGRVFFPPKISLRWAAELCSAICHIHKAHIIHRDIKVQTRPHPPPPLYTPFPSPCPSPPSPPLLPHRPSSLTSSSSPAAAFQHFPDCPRHHQAW